HRELGSIRRDANSSKIAFGTDGAEPRAACIEPHQLLLILLWLEGDGSVVRDAHRSLAVSLEVGHTVGDGDRLAGDSERASVERHGLDCAVFGVNEIPGLAIPGGRENIGDLRAAGRIEPTDIHPAGPDFLIRIEAHPEEEVAVPIGQEVWE